MPAATVTEALAALQPSAALPESAYAARFREVAELLLARTRLWIAGQPHRFTEVELYFTGPSHPDPYTHGDPLQRTLGRWYFHRSGGRYRGGTYKGVDIAFGRGESAVGGILVRGVEPLGMAAPPGADLGVAPAAELVDGPCLVVDHMLALTGSRSIEELVSRLGGELAIEGSERRGLLCVELGGGGRGGDGATSPLAAGDTGEDAAGSGRGDPLHAVTVYATPRIGLTLKKGDTAERRRFLARPYRFLSEPARIRKGKPHLVTALHQQGRSPEEIAAITGARRSVIQSYVDAFEAGRRERRPPAERADLSPAELCRLLGALAEP